MKQIIILTILFLISACSSKPQIVEHRDIFKDFKELSNTICGGDFLYDSNCDIYNSTKRQLIENHLINNNIRKMTDEEMNILFAETMNLILYKNEYINKI